MSDRGRQQIELFARAMEHEVDCNEHKGDPMNTHALEHVHELIYHAAKLYMALRFGQREAALEFAADCGNHAWMAADSAGVLELALLNPEPEGGNYDQAIWARGDNYEALKGLIFTKLRAELGDLAHEIEAERECKTAGIASA